MNRGWIYVLANPLMGGLVKIGRTDRSPSERAVELSAATGVPTPFILVWHEEVSDSEAAEGKIHEILDQYRVSVGREFFRIDVKAAIEAVCMVTAGFQIVESEAPAEESREEKWERDDELFIAAFQLVRKKKEEHAQLPMKRRMRESPESVDPRVLRLELKMSWEESRRIFQRLQDLGAVNSSGTPL